MTTNMDLKENLDYIRSVVDMEICDDIESIKGKGQSIAGVLGLSAECKAFAKKELEQSKAIALSNLTESESKLGATLIMRILDGRCADQNAQFVYADRLNAAVTHQLEYLRSLFSYSKQELINEMNASRSNLNT